MKTITMFNNKGGVGKTTLAFHLAHMLSRLGYRTLSVDLDPQANLTSAFMTDNELESLWERKETILASVEPIIQGTGDIAPVVIHDVAPNLWLIAGDLGLSMFEDKLSEAWGKVGGSDPAAIRQMSAFHRIIQDAGRRTKADVSLIDVGPNLGAINRATMLAADYVVIPLAPDLFSLQGLRNLGPTLRNWSTTWSTYNTIMKTPPVEVPRGLMKPAGYVVLQHAVRADRPVQAYAKWMQRIPGVYSDAVLGMNDSDITGLEEAHRLGLIKNYRSLMPMAHDARKPIFDLTSADGAIGSHVYSVQTCRQDFQDLASAIIKACQLILTN
jgi:cellulose biosynthesis protein BcsQ